MTILDVPLAPHRLSASVHSVRRILPMAGCALPAGMLRDPGVAAWVRNHGLAVTVCGEEELDLVQASGIRPIHVVMRCGLATGTVRRAAALGVVRFVVSSDRHVDVLAGCAQPTKHVYLDDRGPAVLGERRLDVVGMHCDVDASRGYPEWGVAAERLLSRMALIQTWGMTLTRISLSGGSAATWLAGDTRELKAISTAVDDALDAGCARWRLPRPAVVLAPLAE
ncbi:hypothetical protein [Mycobacterium sp. 236(2023)]|uniref:hypothetical protein n=1 Tax=Mycobacterium sp. 236(2023) TaxID=3038163 RepID=UPI0024151E36|nr:hypothetical protein [Mycobacterium sp. 236(2023)]MDG4665929.1 hypothetical protein [Mycobacterium sp. 236(2023)]